MGNVATTTVSEAKLAAIAEAQHHLDDAESAIVDHVHPEDMDVAGYVAAVEAARTVLRLTARLEDASGDIQ